MTTTVQERITALPLVPDRLQAPDLVALEPPLEPRPRGVAPHRDMPPPSGRPADLPGGPAAPSSSWVPEPGPGPLRDDGSDDGWLVQGVALAALAPLAVLWAWAWPVVQVVCELP